MGLFCQQAQVVARLQAPSRPSGLPVRPTARRVLKNLAQSWMDDASRRSNMWVAGAWAGRPSCSPFTI